MIAQLPPRPDVLARRELIVAGLRRLLPPDAVIAEPHLLKPYETDAMSCHRQVPLAVALPSSTAEVAAVMAFLHREGVCVVPRGAGTSLSGGALPMGDAVVLGMMRMNHILEIDYADRLAVVEAGVTNLGITQAMAGEGFFYAPDPSSQLACMIGGNVAMNSGGAHCLRYGVTTNNLLGLKLVTVEGEVVDVGGAHLDAAGYDWLQREVMTQGAHLHGKEALHHVFLFFIHQVLVPHLCANEPGIDLAEVLASLRVEEKSVDGVQRNIPRRAADRPFAG